ncbi:hypothetical protein ACQKOH_11505 [Sphingomonas sp. NPDC092331]|uniref:hypothetical protein n=1 Tax=unclassified Sphingomonas TaxID=196159 RepID=UPI0029E86DD6|nr:hypothetical protein [Pseudomonadota bacterium]
MASISQTVDALATIAIETISEQEPANLYLRGKVQPIEAMSVSWHDDEASRVLVAVLTSNQTAYFGAADLIAIETPTV